MSILQNSKNDSGTPLLSVENLSVCYPTQFGKVHALQQVNLNIYPGKTLVLIGESGCGKSTLGRTLLGLLPSPGVVTDGRIQLSSPSLQNLVTLPQKRWQELRGLHISLILQDPVQALNPVLTIERQMLEAMRAHTKISRREARFRSLSLLKQLLLQNPERMLLSYPFQLSGGMCQRIAIAIALVNNAKLMVADEPTTALDVSVQATILNQIKDLQSHLGLSLLLITHDVGVADDVADDVAIMYAGRIIETGNVNQVFKHPAHPYTSALLDCFPDGNGTVTNALPGQPPNLLSTPDICPFLPRCRIKDEVCKKSTIPRLKDIGELLMDSHYCACYHPLNRDGIIELSKKSKKAKNSVSVSSFRTDVKAPKGGSITPLLKIEGIRKTYYKTGLFKKQVQGIAALNDVTLTIAPGEILGVVGESGCGKTTLGRCILGLEIPDKGQIWLEDKNLTQCRGKNLRDVHRIMQPIFQSPRDSLNSGRIATDLVAEPLHYYNQGTVVQRRERARWILNQVGIDSSLMTRKPNALSTGQCQRVAIARALILSPRLLICDEPLSALDLSVQAQILSLFAKLHTNLKFSMLFISHNILVVKSISNRIVVMNRGKICETISAEQSLCNADHPYTKKLFQAIPRLSRNSAQ